MAVLESIIPIVIILFVLVVLNVVFLAIIYFTQRKVNAINEWPTTTGKILTSQTEWRSSGESSAEYPVVLYSYRANAQEFQGRRIAPGMEVGGIGARKVVERYPVNSQVTVYYNPQNPEDAVLEKKAGSQILLWVLLVVFDCALCGAIPLILWASSSA
jgi:flagellar basal body-associated protein FliL